MTDASESAPIASAMACRNVGAGAGVLDSLEVGDAPGHGRKWPVVLADRPIPDLPAALPRRLSGGLSGNGGTVDLEPTHGQCVVVGCPSTVSVIWGSGTPPAGKSLGS